MLQGTQPKQPPQTTQTYTPGTAGRFEVTSQSQERNISPQGGGQTVWHVSFTSHPSGTGAAVTLADENYTARTVHDTISTLADELENVAQHPLVSKLDQQQTYDPQQGPVAQMNVHIISQPSGTKAMLRTPVAGFAAANVIPQVEALSSKIESVHALTGTPPTTQPAPTQTPAPGSSRAA